MKKILVCTDFDQTMIKEESAVVLVKKLLHYYSRKVSKFNYIKLLFRLLRKVVKYEIKGSVRPLYEAFFYFDKDLLTNVVKKFHFNKKWIRHIKRIKKNNPRSKIDLIIISRGMGDIIAKFLEIKKNKEFLMELECDVIKIIANTDIIIGQKAIIQRGLWKKGKKMPYIGKNFKINTGKLTKEHIDHMARIQSLSSSKHKSKVLKIIDKNKNKYLSKGELKGYYIGDKQENYLKKYFPKDKFLPV